MALSETHLIGRPLKVYWAGWETTTARLSAAGWSLTVEKGIYESRVSLFMKHPDGMTGHATCDGELYNTMFGRFQLDVPYFNVHKMSNHMHVVTYCDPKMFADSFYAMSGRPSVINTSEVKLDDIPGFFTPVRAQVQEIIVEPQSVQECFDLIKKLQAPDLEKIRERNRKREPIVQAQILSFGG